MRKLLLLFFLFLGVCFTRAKEPVKGIIVTYDGSDVCYKFDDVPTVKYKDDGCVRHALLFLKNIETPVVDVALSGENMLVVTFGEYVSDAVEGVIADKVTIAERNGKKIIQGGKLVIIGWNGKMYNASGVQIK